MWNEVVPLDANLNACGELPNFKDKDDSLLNHVAPKLKDSGCFSITCRIGKTTFNHILCDLGVSVSVMPLHVFQSLSLKNLISTDISLQLANSTERKPLGIAKDIMVKVQKSFIPTDFVVLETSKTPNFPLILGKPFLATSRAIIDIKNGKLVFNVPNDCIKFHMPTAKHISLFEKSVCRKESEP